MRKSVWMQNYEINTFLVTPERKLGLVAVLNLLQDIAGVHANHLGFGFESVLEKKLLWVLTRQKLVMQKWPAWNEVVKIVTWCRPYEGVYAFRDFLIYHGDQQIGECTTSWITLDLDSRKPKKGDLNELLMSEPPSVIPFKAPKVVPEKEFEVLMQFPVRNSDIDMNQHVNNTRYAQWILDSIPMEWHQQYELHQYEINFLAETKLGDLISLQKCPTEPKIGLSGETSDAGRFWTKFQGWREADQKYVFGARLQVSEKLKC